MTTQRPRLGSGTWTGSRLIGASQLYLLVLTIMTEMFSAAFRTSESSGGRTNLEKSGSMRMCKTTSSHCIVSCWTCGDWSSEDASNVLRRRKLICLNSSAKASQAAPEVHRSVCETVPNESRKIVRPCFTNSTAV
ncbi:uncharacterized protein BJ212DRAFT_1379151 [Suillus subaureus]|uniref:Uncharacterized protein n=1 Tax=Suillus subaureus TaxID=48587 RepID=A0A9P7E2I8_9AGAM|nr:uncharacterized protein BJ212DRAFT_1379151 [Suillus subaureus]KAG1809698.1 hypothetical protein BJ212DRAFT_1379151 [Suillus subaureus]